MVKHPAAKAACGFRLQQVIICNGHANSFLNFMVITLRLQRGNDSAVRCQILVYRLTSGVTCNFTHSMQDDLLQVGFGFKSCHAHPTVKMLQHRSITESLLYILVAVIKLSLFVCFFL